MSKKTGFFASITLFLCFVVTGFFGASTVLPSGDESENAKFKATVEAMMRASSSGKMLEDNRLKDKDLIYPQGSETTTNTWYGKLAGSNIIGTYNSCFGYYAGGSVGLSGIANSFFGAEAGDANTSGNKNTFVGEDAGGTNTIGYNNTYVGEDAGYAHNGDENTFVGQNAGGQGLLSSGDRNTFLGSLSGYANSGNFGTFIGYQTGNSGTGNLNTFVGYRACIDTGVGLGNTFVGASVGDVNVNGSANTIIGMTGARTAIGDRNIFIGAFAGANETGSDRLYIGSGVGSTPLIYGEFDNKFLKINGNFTATATSVSSDNRLKKEIEPIESPLKKVSKIQGVRYRWKVDEFPERGLSVGKQIGLIAQDVEQVMPELVSEDKDGYKAVSYSKLTAVLVEAVKELKAENQKREGFLIDQLKKQQTEIEELRAMIKELKS